MVAWKKFGNNSTPESEGLKGDHFVGKYYIKYNQEYQRQVKDLINSGFSVEDSKQKAPILIEAKEMLLKWESGNKDIIKLWKMMNDKNLFSSVGNIITSAVEQI